MDKLEKQLGLIDIFSLASGAMISSGLFVLPTLIYSITGPSVVIVYLVASILILPTVLSKSELATAMPKAGGTYFYIQRSLGTAFGFFSGLAGWFSLAAKTAFALIGIGIFAGYFADNLGYKLTPFQIMLTQKFVAIVFCLCFMGLNIYSIKSSAKFQIWLVVALIIILSAFIIFSIPKVNMERFHPFYKNGMTMINFITAIGMVFVSYGGLTKIASIAEEIKKPAVNLPRGMLLAWFIVSILYFLAVATTVSILKPDVLEKTLTPLSTAAEVNMGKLGFALLTLAAMAAFITTANAGIMAASRSPMAMSRDGMLPASLAKVNSKFNTPHMSIILTSLFMVAMIAFLKLETLVKTASALIIMLYALENISVIIMRESKLQSYRPTFKSPGYPYIQIIAVIAYSVLIAFLGFIPLILSAMFIIFSAGWYYFILSKKIKKTAAIMQIVERITDKELQSVELENELRDILIERDEIIEDRFDRLIKACYIMDIQENKDFKIVISEIASIMSKRIDVSFDLFKNKLMEREAQGSTIITPGLAIPHVIIPGEKLFDVMLVRSKCGIKFPHSEDLVSCIFVLTGSRDERNYHLRALMAIAQIAQSPDFNKRWQEASDIERLRNIILLATRKRE